MRNVVTGSRTRLDPEARRAQLVDLGLEMLSTRPLDQVAIEDIAAAAGISRGLLFHYFPSKRDFHEAVVRAAAAHLLARTEPDPSLPFMDQLQSAVAAFVDYVIENRDGYVSLVRGAAGSDPALQAVFEQTRATICQRILDRLGPDSTPRRVRLAVRGWVAFGEEIVIDWLSDPPAEGDLDRDSLVDMLDAALVTLVALAASSASSPGEGTPTAAKSLPP
jgi:AcrR family transcriptional regulator